MLTGTRIVLGVTGGIAAYKAVEICRRLVDLGAHVSPVLTSGAQRFIGHAGKPPCRMAGESQGQSLGIRAGFIDLEIGLDLGHLMPDIKVPSGDDHTAQGKCNRQKCGDLA